MNYTEETSARVASIAAKIINMDKPPLIITNEFWAEIKSLAGSALTQAPNKIVKLGIDTPFGTPQIGAFGKFASLLDLGKANGLRRVSLPKK